ncbi:HPr-rel-A system PqqD family peptide chaperone [Sorangium sp. So ce302]|uniref:HPr-rel-A system PqqD family peptide chaperone n=1 Tax=unclassified Sorangium TaxID=2621164 RepID=UPI003F616F8D
MSAILRLKELALSDTGFVFDPASGATFTVNPTGLCALNAMKEGLSREEVAARLRERFDIRGGDPARDVGEFLELLRQHGLLSAEPEGAQ